MSVTEGDLRRSLATLGVIEGRSLIVHSSLRAIGWVHEGAPTVVRALIGAVADRGTLAMPAATPLPKEGIAPVFEIRTTPTTMGAIAETFRTWPSTLRSDHPLESFCARGPDAKQVTCDHPLAFSEGLGSPLAKLHDLGADILLLGVGFNRCTALHFAESLVEKRRTTTVRFPTTQGEWRVVSNVADDNGEHFPEIGRQFLAAAGGRQGQIGGAASILVPMRPLVSFARDYFNRVL